MQQEVQRKEELSAAKVKMDRMMKELQEEYRSNLKKKDEEIQILKRINAEKSQVGASHTCSVALMDTLNSLHACVCPPLGGHVGGQVDGWADGWVYVFVYIHIHEHGRLPKWAPLVPHTITTHHILHQGNSASSIVTSSSRAPACPEQSTERNTRTLMFLQLHILRYVRLSLIDTTAYTYITVLYKTISPIQLL